MKKKLIKLLRHNPIAIASINKDWTPHIAWAYWVVEKEWKLVITNNFMKTTVKNIENNENIEIIVWDEDLSWFRVKWKAKHDKSPIWIDFLSSQDYNQWYNPKWAIILEIAEIKEIS